MGKLFGTDGIRGVVNAGLDADLAYKVGLAAAEVLASGKKAGEKPLVTIGKDTRISGDLLKGSLIAGLCTAGADVLDLGTLPTPGVAWVTVDEKADAGIVISASHNPFEHNGIKIFNGQGRAGGEDRGHRPLCPQQRAPQDGSGDRQSELCGGKGRPGLHRPSGGYH